MAATPSSGDLFAHLSKPSSQLTFEELGVREPIVKALQVAYPDVRFPTTSQSEFIPAILSGRDVLLKDATGTGKCVAFHLLGVFARLTRALGHSA